MGRFSRVRPITLLIAGSPIDTSLPLRQAGGGAEVEDHKAKPGPWQDDKPAAGEEAKPGPWQD